MDAMAGRKQHEVVRHPRVLAHLGRASRLGQTPREGPSLVHQRIEAREDQVGRRKGGEVAAQRAREGIAHLLRAHEAVAEEVHQLGVDEGVVGAEAVKRGRVEGHVQPGAHQQGRVRRRLPRGRRAQAHGGCRVAPRRVARHRHASPGRAQLGPMAAGEAVGGEAVLLGRRKRVLGRQAVGHGEHGGVGGQAQAPHEGVVRVEAHEEVAAAVEEDDERTGGVRLRRGLHQARAHRSPRRGDVEVPRSAHLGGVGVEQGDERLEARAQRPGLEDALRAPRGHEIEEPLHLGVQGLAGVARHRASSGFPGRLAVAGALVRGLRGPARGGPGETARGPRVSRWGAASHPRACAGRQGPPPCAISRRCPRPRTPPGARPPRRAPTPARGPGRVAPARRDLRAGAPAAVGPPDSGGGRRRRRCRSASWTPGACCRAARAAS